MNVSMFYGSHRWNATRFRTLAKASEQAEASASFPVNVVVLPPADEDKNNDRDVENEAVNNVNGTDFETVGEVELEEEDSENEDVDADCKETPAQPKAKKQHCQLPTWKKKLDYDQPIPANDFVILEELQMLQGSTPFGLFERFFP